MKKAVQATVEKTNSDLRLRPVPGPGARYLPLRRTWIQFLIPLFGISILLIALGFFAAWHVQRQQVLTSEVIAREVESMVVMQDVYSALREYRRMLDLYLRVHDVAQVQLMPRLHENALSGLSKAHLLARNEVELNQVEIVAHNYERFHSELLTVLAHPETPADQKRLAELNDSVLTNQVLAPALA